MGLLLCFLLFGCTTNTSVGGASLTTGHDLNDDYHVINESTTFGPGEEFNYSFDNGSAFEADQLQLQLIQSNNDEVLVDHYYDVEEDWTILADTIWFADPGKYKIAVFIDGSVRATQEVIIE